MLRSQKKFQENKFCYHLNISSSAVLLNKAKYSDNLVQINYGKQTSTGTSESAWQDNFYFSCKLFVFVLQYSHFICLRVGCFISLWSCDVRKKLHRVNDKRTEPQLKLMENIGFPNNYLSYA